MNITTKRHQRALADLEELRREYRDALAAGNEVAAAAALDTYRIIRDWIAHAGRPVPPLTTERPTTPHRTYTQLSITGGTA